jgi:predicted nucleotidyltransferase
MVESYPTPNAVMGRRPVMTAVEKAILDKFKSLLAKRLRLHKLILFGSRARGDADPQSDLDVLVILKRPVAEADRDYVSDCAWEAGLQHGIVVLPVVVDRRAWEKGPEHHSLLAQAVQRDGIPV